MISPDDRCADVAAGLNRRGDFLPLVIQLPDLVRRRNKIYAAAGEPECGAVRCELVAAAMTIRELTDLVDANGLDAAIRIAAGKAEQLSRGRRMVETGRRLVEYYESMWSSGVWDAHPAGGTDMPRWRPREGIAGGGRLTERPQRARRIWRGALNS